MKKVNPTTSQSQWKNIGTKIFLVFRNINPNRQPTINTYNTDVKQIINP